MEPLVRNPDQSPSMTRRFAESSTPSRKFVLVTAFILAAVSVAFAILHLLPLFTNPRMQLSLSAWFIGVLPIVVISISGIVAFAIEWTANRSLKLAMPIFLAPSLISMIWVAIATCIDVTAGMEMTSHYLMLCGLRLAVSVVACFYFLIAWNRRRGWLA